MKVLLDTNVISELVVKKPNAIVIDWIDQLVANDVYLSVVTIGEIQKGITRLAESKRKTELLVWLQNDLLVQFEDHILELDVQVMLTWGALVGRLEREGRSLGAIDSIIAAQALHYDCTLATRNQAHFLGIGITVINPWHEESTI